MTRCLRDFKFQVDIFSPAAAWPRDVDKKVITSAATTPDGVIIAAVAVFGNIWISRVARIRPRARDGEPEDGPSQTPSGPADAVRPQFFPENESEESSSSEKSGDTDSQGGLGERIMVELQNIEREVSENRERLRFNPPEDREDLLGPGFVVLVTRYGTVMNGASLVPPMHLTNPRVGPAHPSRWCPKCREFTRPRGRPLAEFPVLISGVHGRFHTDSLCPKTKEMQFSSTCA